MAESVVFSLGSKILSTIASPAFDKAYERGLSIWEAKDELAKLRVTIETIQAVLLDAERKQESSAAVRNWIKRLKGVLYDADDLFDEVATDDLCKQQMMKGSNKLSLKNKELEYVEDGDSCTAEVVGSSSFFPRLQLLVLDELPKLKGWWSEVATSSSMFLSFPLLSRLNIQNCPQLKSIPLCPVLDTLTLIEMDGNMVIQHLGEIKLGRGVDWDSLSNLRLIWLYPLPPPEKLPECLLHRQSLGQLKITGKGIKIRPLRTNQLPKKFNYVQDI